MGKNKNKNRGGYTAAEKNTGAMVFTIALFVVIAAYFITALALGIKAGAPVWNPLKWGKAGATQTQPGGDETDNNPVIAVGSDGEALRTGSAYSLRRSADNGITYLTETQNNQTYVPQGEIIVTAELSNEYIHGAFDWSVDFVNPAAEWAVGKVAAYYVSVEPVAGDSASATLRYLAPFGEQIILTATLRGSDSSDSCTIDCVKPVMSFMMRVYDSDFDDSNAFGIQSIIFGLGTVTGDLEFACGRVAVEEDFAVSVQSYLKFDVTFKSSSFHAADVTWTSDDSQQVACGDLAYSMLIEGFDDYDDAHKEAIYYAWFTAFDKDYDGNNNALIDTEFLYLYNGATVSGLYDSDCIGFIHGSNYGYDITPNTQLNQNYVF